MAIVCLFELSSNYPLGTTFHIETFQVGYIMWRKYVIGFMKYFVICGNMQYRLYGHAHRQIIKILPRTICFAVLLFSKSDSMLLKGFKKKC